LSITRTAVELRVKAVAARSSRDVGVDGLNEGGTAFVRRLRQRREATVPPTSKSAWSLGSVSEARFGGCSRARKPTLASLVAELV